MTGDFNCIESERDKFGGNVTLSNHLQDLRDIYHLVDIWYKTHGRQIQCTWFNSTKTIGSRLDKPILRLDRALAGGQFVLT